MDAEAIVSSWKTSRARRRLAKFWKRIAPASAEVDEPQAALLALVLLECYENALQDISAKRKDRKRGAGLQAPNVGIIMGGANMNKATEPKRPEAAPVEETEETVRERLATLEQDRKTAKPWAVVKASILQHPKPR